MASSNRSPFPIIVGVLTVALALFIAYAVTHHTAATTAPASSSSQQPAVSDAAYQTQMKGILLSFDAAYPQAKNDIARLVLVEDTLNKVLAVRVPADEQSFHLNVAIALNEWRTGLRGDAKALAAGRKAYADAEASAAWLK